MLSRILKFIFLMIILTGMNLVYAALTPINSGSGLIIRPQVKYESSALRDPFRSCLVKEGAASGTQSTSKLAQLKINLDTLVVQGVIWGGKIPQAIINNKVLAVGDLIEGGKIISIEKSGIILNFSGEIVTLSTPGQAAMFKRIDKTKEE